jgi:hypothetical protein
MKSRDWEIVILGDREYYKWQFREIMAMERPEMTDEQFDAAWHRAQLGQVKLLQMLSN